MQSDDVKNKIKLRQINLNCSLIQLLTSIHVKYIHIAKCYLANKVDF